MIQSLGKRSAWPPLRVASFGGPKKGAMWKNLLLTLVVTSVTLLITIGLIRWLAPTLLGVSPDMQLVKLSKAVPAFYEGIFRSEDLESETFILPDPIAIKRARPLMADGVVQGPHDILGFRNHSVPRVADVITIGDSQTYGMSEVLHHNWPSKLAEGLPGPKRVVYNMSCGGWDGVQYLYAFEKALYLQPKVVVVAFYSGNDPVGAFAAAYGAPHWFDLRPDPSLRSGDAPVVSWPPTSSEMWVCRFDDGTTTVFTPQLRLSSNMDGHPAVEAGWRVLEEIARRIGAMAADAGVPVIFTMIPTKELVYAPRIRREGIEVTPAFDELVNSEEKFIHRFASRVRKFEDSPYVDVLRPLQKAAGSQLLYPEDENGHPSRHGYAVIAGTLSQEVARRLPYLPTGLLDVAMPDRVVPMLVSDEGRWLFDSADLVAANGWGPLDGQSASASEVAGVRIRGVITGVDFSSWGPDAFR